MSSIHNDPAGTPIPSTEDQARAKKNKKSAANRNAASASAGTTAASTPKMSEEAARIAAARAANPAPVAGFFDHMHLPAKVPISTGDAFDAGTQHAAPEGRSAMQTAAGLGKAQLLGQGIKGLFMLKPVRAMLSVGGLEFVRKPFTQVLPDQQPLGAGATFKRMLLGAVFGGATMMICSSVPLGILGAALSAAGPAAIPILATIAALTLYGAVAGAYQAYQTCRPLKTPMHSVQLTKEGQGHTVKADRARTVRLDRISERAKPTALPPPATTTSATAPLGAGDSDDSDTPVEVDASAAADNASTQEEIKTAKAKATVAGSVDREQSQNIKHRQQGEE